MGLWLPGASRDPENDGGEFTRAPRVGVIHSTEGSGWPAYDSGQGVAPHLTVSLLDREVRQHVPFDRAARALANASGGVETNRAGAIQVEVIGTCDLRLAQERGIHFLPSMDDASIDYLAGVIARVHVETGIPLSTSVTWKDYNKGQEPSSYGRDNGVRLDAAAWRGYSGWLGHMHVPENTHGDPGNIPITRVLARAVTIMATQTLSLPVVPPAVVPPVVPMKPNAPRETTSVQASPLPPGTTVGAFPLPVGHWFGPESRDHRVHSGYYPADAASIALVLAALRRRGWRNVPTTDRYTRDVVDLVERYQLDADLRRDGRLGRHTWLSIAQSPIR